MRPCGHAPRRRLSCAECIDELGRLRENVAIDLRIVGNFARPAKPGLRAFCGGAANRNAAFLESSDRTLRFASAEDQMAKKALTAASLAKLGSKSDQPKALVVLRKGNAI